MVTFCQDDVCRCRRVSQILAPIKGQALGAYLIGGRIGMPVFVTAIYQTS
jgi:hypothetical protein